MIFAVVEDSRSQAEVLKALLKSEGYQVEVFANGESFLAALHGGGFDFYVIDWALPDISGDILVGKIREQCGWDVPVVVCTARTEEDFASDILRQGADDYIPKPVRYMEFLARVNVLLRRVQGKTPSLLRFGRIELDVEGRRIRLNGQEVELTQREFDLAVVLLNNIGRVLGRRVRQMVDGANNFSLLSIPFFIVMGEFMSAGGISEKIVDLANLAVGRFRGGLAYVNVLDSMFFGGISGSAVADVSSLGTIVIPMMVKQGYDEDFSVGLTVTTACQGVLIPPSHNMVIYALAAGGVSIGTLFMAGLLPGIALGCGMIIMCMMMAKRYNFPKGEGVAKGEGIKVLLRGILPMMTLIIIMVGTSAGVFTATEASAIACVYTMFLSMVVFRSVKLRDVGGILKNSLKTLAIVMTLLATAKAFAYMMTELRIPAMITAALLSITSNKYVLMLIINILLLLLGCFMDMAPLITIMTPILLPVVTNPAIGMDPVHFGVVMIFNLAVGLCTPPVGSALFVGCAIGKTPIERTSKNMLPLYAVMVTVLLLVTYIPEISLWLPRMTGYAG